jgi:site-specific DNA-methyltransferase (adenine-specific)
MTESPARLLLGDCVQLMAQMAAETIDAMVTDPPYDLTAVSRGGSRRKFVNNPYGRTRVGTDGGGFMGKTWDATGVAFRVQTWREALQVLKPGGHLLAFGGTRTYHRMVCAIEDAGFEIRDSIIWLYGSGFPKSLDVGKAIDEASQATQHRLSKTADRRWRRTEHARPWNGWGTALKPAHEAIVVARKPLSEASVAANFQRHGTAAINVDGCRVGFTDALDEAAAKTKNRHTQFGSGARTNRVYGRDCKPRPDYDPPGRWPANVILSHSSDCRQVPLRSDGGWEEAWDCCPGCPVAELDRQSGQSRSNVGGPRSSKAPGVGYGMTHTGAEYNDRGGASRFFYVAKASTRERNLGLEDFGDRPMPWPAGSTSTDGLQSAAARRAAHNQHPCVKPITLMRYLCRLVTPPGGTVLDPFMGSGSTGVAAVLEGFSFVGIDRDEGYLDIARARVDRAERDGPSDARAA